MRLWGWRVRPAVWGKYKLPAISGDNLSSGTDGANPRNRALNSEHVNEGVGSFPVLRKYAVRRHRGPAGGRTSMLVANVCHIWATRSCSSSSDWRIFSPSGLATPCSVGFGTEMGPTTRSRRRRVGNPTSHGIARSGPPPRVPPRPWSVRCVGPKTSEPTTTAVTAWRISRRPVTGVRGAIVGRRRAPAAAPTGGRD